MASKPRISIKIEKVDTVNSLSLDLSPSLGFGWRIGTDSDLVNGDWKSGILGELLKLWYAVRLKIGSSAHDQTIL